MTKKPYTKQSKLNLIFGILLFLCIISIAFLTYMMFEFQKANESVDGDLSSQIFELRIEKADKK